MYHHAYLAYVSGVLLLLFTTIAANTTEDPPTSSEKLSTEIIDRPSNATISVSNETIANKIASRNSGSTETENEAVDPSNNSTDQKDPETARESKDGEAEREEKVAIPTIHEDDQLARLPAADSSPNPGSSKLEDSIYGTSAGKSSSTKTLSEDFYRLSRTNGLTTVTAKPALEEGKMDGTRNGVQMERSNVTTSWQESLASKIPKSSIVYRFDFPEGKGDKMKAEAKKERSEESSLQKVRFLEKEEEQDEEKREESGEKKGSKNSEVAGLKGEVDPPISLINDTYVNYSHRYKTSTAEVSRENGSENGTNLIGEESTVVTHHPKEEVEVVGNVTQPAIQRIVEPRSRNATSKDANLGNVESGEIASNRNEDYSRRDPAKVNETSSVEIQRETSGNDGQKLVQFTTTSPIATTTTTTITTTTEKTFQEGSSTTSSPVPRGRTIAFAMETNEFARSTPSSRLDVSYTRRNESEDKGTKPYPYAKSSSKESSAPDSSNRLLIEITTEEGSAMENTIGKGRSEEKLIVTEASDVLENSIQQRSKPAYRDEGSGSNESSTASSHVARPSPTPTDSSTSVPRGSSTERGMIQGSSREESSTSVGNDVPRWNDSQETVSSSVDVTGNGITEVRPRPEESRPRDELPFRQITEPSFRSSDLPSIQRNSSMEPLVPANTERSASSSSPVATTIEQTFVANATESSPQSATSDANATNEIPSSDPDQSFAPTTTGVEYEFVSLSFDSTEYPPPRNSTTEEASTGEDAAADRTSSTVPDLFSPTKNDSNEAPTTLMPPSDESDDSSSMNETTDRATITTTVFVPPNWVTRGSRDEAAAATTRTSLLEEGIGWSGVDEVARTTDGFPLDSWSTVEDGKEEEEGIATISSDSKDTTEQPAQFTPMSSVNATDGTVAPSATPSEHSISSTVSSPTIGSRDVPSRKSDNALPTRQEITWLVRIVMEGGRYDVCPKMDKLKAILANILQSGINK